MKATTREIVLGVLLILACIGWYVDRQKQSNLTAVAQRQMDRYYWQADKLANWVRKDHRVKSIDVNLDTITIKLADGESEVFNRTPPK